MLFEKDNVRKLFEIHVQGARRSFLNPATVQTEVLYQQAIDAADLKGGRDRRGCVARHWDDELSLCRDAKVYAMIVDDGVMAKENTKLNGATNVH